MFREWSEGKTERHSYNLYSFGRMIVCFIRCLLIRLETSLKLVSKKHFRSKKDKQGKWLCVHLKTKTFLPFHISCVLWKVISAKRFPGDDLAIFPVKSSRRDFSRVYFSLAGFWKSLFTLLHFWSVYSQLNARQSEFVDSFKAISY